MKIEIGAFIAQDSSKCTGCKACELACFAAHTALPGQTVGTVTTPITPKLFVTAGEHGCAPVQCRHCEDAPCRSACTRGAISHIAGRVIVDTTQCIGCPAPTCAAACPFGAIKLLPYAAKCDLCADLSGGPACVAACPNAALRLTDPEAERQTKNIRAAQALLYTR